MPGRWLPAPEDLHAEEYRRAHAFWDREPVPRVERAGFGGREGYRGAYEERLAYRMPRGMLRRSGRWRRGRLPAPVPQPSREAEARRARAFRDRELARAVDFALYDVIGREADYVAVYADDGVITLEGRLHRAAAAAAIDTARRTPGVRWVRSMLEVWKG